MSTQKPTGPLAQHPHLAAFLAEVMQANVAPIPYRAVQPGDKVGKTVSPATLQLAAYARDLERQAAVIKASTPFVYDEAGLTEQMVQVRKIGAKRKLAMALFELSFYSDADAWTGANPTLREGGVAVETEAARRQQEMAVATQLDHASRGAALAVGGGSLEDASPFGRFIDVDLDGFLKLMGEDEGDEAGIVHRIARLIERGERGRRPNGHDPHHHGH